MGEREFLIKKYKGFGCERISEFVRQTGSELSQETWGAVINRGDNANLRTLLKMCADLNCSTEEVYSLLVTRGETQIARTWIKPTDVSPEEMKLVNKLRQIKDPKKIRLLSDMLDNL